MRAVHQPLFSGALHFALLELQVASPVDLLGRTMTTTTFQVALLIISVAFANDRG